MLLVCDPWDTARECESGGDCGRPGDAADPNPSWSPQYNTGDAGQENWEGKPQAKSTATSGEGEGPRLTQATHIAGQIRLWYTPPVLCLTHMYT